jgi:predicted Zn finger-like uncharacterized protein
MEPGFLFFVDSLVRSFFLRFILAFFSPGLHDSDDPSRYRRPQGATMPITVSCSNCKSVLRVPDTAEGRKVKCPKCTTVIDVPATAIIVGPAPTHSKPTPVPDGRPLPPRRDANENLEKAAVGSRRDVDDDVDKSRVRSRRDDDDYGESPRSRRRDLDDDDDDDDDDDERSIRRRRLRRSSDGGGLQQGLGIASLSVGSTGLTFAVIPFCGAVVAIPACAIGLILGLISLIMSLSHNKRGLGFPIAGSSVSFVGLVIAVVWWLWIFATVHKAADDFKNIAGQMKNQRVGRPVLGQGIVGGPIAGKITLVGGQGSVNAQLTNADPVRPDAIGLQVHYKKYTVELTKGKSYQIDMISQVLDSYLILQDGRGNVLMEDDDGGDNLDSRIIFQCPESGTYHIIATELGAGGGGPFSLRIKEL